MEDMERDLRGYENAYCEEKYVVVSLLGAQSIEHVYAVQQICVNE